MRKVGTFERLIALLMGKRRGQPGRHSRESGNPESNRRRPHSPGGMSQLKR